MNDPTVRLLDGPDLEEGSVQEMFDKIKEVFGEEEPCVSSQSSLFDDGE